MALDGGKLICLNDGVSSASQAEIISARGKTFKFGYYTDCDVVLEHPDALGLHCTIDCDAFGRVTIENQCKEHPIKLDGKAVSKTRPLLHNTEICILDRKFRWQFERKHHPVGFQMEDLTDFTTPSKPIKQAEQAPNSEPNRRWRYPFYNRLTIHSFAYCIKAGESPQDVEITRDENKPLNVYDAAAEAKLIQEKNKRRSSSLPPDLINLKTPKVRRPSFPGRKTPLSVCKLSETVITSYSPRETGVRPEKSFAEVRSIATTPTKSLALSDITLGPFHHLPSPLTKNNQRPSMYLIDLTTPTKLAPSQASPSRTLLKSTLKKNLPKALVPQQRAVSTPDKIPTSSDSSVCSIHSIDEDSVIELSDEGSFSPSPVVKTPPRSRTPTSLMKRAILSSAKKAAITKRIEQTASSSPLTPITPKITTRTNIRFQSQSTPPRRSLGRLHSSREDVMSSHSSAGKPGRSMITSTPFRRDGSICKATRRSSISGSPSTSLPCLNISSRTSLMLKQALSKNSQMQSAQARKSISFFETTKSPHKPLLKSRKSVSFLDRIEHSQSNVEEEDPKIEEPDDKTTTNSRKDATFSPEKEKCPSELTNQTEVKHLESLPVTQKEQSTENYLVPETPVPNKTDEPSAAQPLLNVTFSPEKDSYIQQIHTDSTSIGIQPVPEVPELIFKKENNATETNNKNSGLDYSSIPETPQSTKIRPKHIKLNPLDSLKKLHPIQDTFEDEDLEGLDTIFKTPKAKNLMILSSPKSVILQKSTNNPIQLIHSAEFDLSSNLEDIFKTPQSELLVNRVEVSTSSKQIDKIEHLSPEEAFDKLVGRPTYNKSYSRKSTTQKQELSPLQIPKDSTFPKTDIEEWIENVQESSKFSEAEQDEDEISFLTATQGDLTVDPLTMSTLRPGSVNTTNKKKPKMSPVEEAAITMIDDDEEDNGESKCSLKDPLEMTAASVKTEDGSISVISPKRSMSPNISGIDLLDHTSDSLFSETLAVSDESSAKETEKTLGLEQTNADATISAGHGGTVTSPEKSRGELEIDFEHFEEPGFLVGDRLISTPEPKKTFAKALCKHGETSSENKIEKQLAFLQTDGDDQTSKSFSISLQDPKITPQMGSVSKAEHDEKSYDVEEEMKLIFKNLEDEPEFTQERTAKTPDPRKISLKDHRTTVGSGLVKNVHLNTQAAKGQRNRERAFKNFKKQPQITQERSVRTPEPKKSSATDHRRTMESSLVKELTFVNEATEQHELELNLENFGEELEFSQEKAAKTPESEKRSTQAFKEQPEMEQDFENSEGEPELLLERPANTPEQKKYSQKNEVGGSLASNDKIALRAAKEQLELELAFKNFEEEPEFSQERAAKTPEPKKSYIKDHRRTMGSCLVKDVTLDLQAAKKQRELEIAFENFVEQPQFTQNRAIQTPEPKKSFVKDHRRTVGNSLVKEVKLDLQAAKEQRELEMAFENFKEVPKFSQERVVKTPEPKKNSLKEHRRTMGSTLVKEVTLDHQAVKEQRELEIAFENFEEQPEFTQERAAQTPEPKKNFVKDHRRTMGSTLVKEVKLDLQAAKEQRELEVAFENFEEQPEFTQERAAQTPEPKKSSVKDHRRTVGSNLVKEVKLDLQAAKEQRELEVAFENFEEQPEFTQERAAQTPEPIKSSVKDHRRTMGSNLFKEVKLDLQAAKEQRELEVAFENFEEQPEFTQERAAQTPEPKKSSVKDHRRTMGSTLVKEVKLDLQAAKEQRELEVAFENFEEQPEFTQERAAQTPDPKKNSVKDHRRTMGSSLVREVTLDIQAAKEQRELEVAFENFEEQPEFTQERAAQTPEPKKSFVKDHRRTMGSTLVKEVKLDLQAAKEQRELELAFENFEEQPEFTQERAAQTPEPKKSSLKEHRRTMGSTLVKEVKLDLQAAKEQRELEMAFENFEEQPEFTQERAAQTPEPKKSSLKEHRRTMGSTLVEEVKLDLQAAKEQRELEMAFENFEEEPAFSQERVVKTPEPKKNTLKEHRRTMGSTMVKGVKLDLQAAKRQRELEIAFENFKEQPEFTRKRSVHTPEPKKISATDHRRTVGSSLVKVVTLDLQAEKKHREVEMAFENFEEEPTFSQKRVVKTPEPKKSTLKEHRRTMGSTLVSEVKFDLQAAKEQRELEMAFENFEEEPEFSQERVVKTPEPKKNTLKEHRRTMGSTMVKEVKLDLQAAKRQRELEIAFENFKEQPEFTRKRSVHTPEPKKSSATDHRRTMGSSLVKEVTLDLQAEKKKREVEMAFENFEEEPTFSQKRVVKTPELKKSTLKEHRRTMGSTLVSELKFDLQAAKEQRELEMAFENFEEESAFTQESGVKTPEAQKISRMNHRKTMRSTSVHEVSIDFQPAKEHREIELPLEMFEKDPSIGLMRVVETPEPKKEPKRTSRLSLGYRKLADELLDPNAFKSKSQDESREKETILENVSTANASNRKELEDLAEENYEKERAIDENRLENEANVDEVPVVAVPSSSNKNEARTPIKSKDASNKSTRSRSRQNSVDSQKRNPSKRTMVPEEDAKRKIPEEDEAKTKDDKSPPIDEGMNRTIEKGDLATKAPNESKTTLVPSSSYKNEARTQIKSKDASTRTDKSTRIKSRQNSDDSQKRNPSKRTIVPENDAKRKNPENEAKTKDDKSPPTDEGTIRTIEKVDLATKAPKESKTTTRNVDHNVESRPLSNPISTSDLSDKADENMCLIEESAEIDIQVVKTNVDETCSDEIKNSNTLEETNNELLKITSQKKTTAVKIDYSGGVTEKDKFENEVYADRGLAEALSSNSLKEETRLQISGEGVQNIRTRTRNRRQISTDVQRKISRKRIPKEYADPEIPLEKETKSTGDESPPKDEERIHIQEKLNSSSTTVNEPKIASKRRKVFRDDEKKQELPLADPTSIIASNLSNKALENISLVVDSSEVKTQGAKGNIEEVFADEIKVMTAYEVANEEISKKSSQKKTNLGSDSDEVIHSTPAQISASSRRHTRKVQCIEHSASATRRGRRGSAKDESGAVRTTPVPLKTRRRAAVVKVEPGESAEEADVEEVVTSSPEPIKKRGRRVLPAQKTAKSVTENKSNKTETVCDLKLVVTEIKSEGIDDSGISNVKHVATSAGVKMGKPHAEEMLPSPATVKTRGRMPALNKLLQPLAESCTPDVQLLTVTTSRTRTRRAAVKEESAHATTENTTPVRTKLRKGAVEQINEICPQSSALVRNEEDLLVVSFKQEIENVTSAPLEVADDIAASTQKENESESIKQAEENIDTNVSAPISKARGRRIKIEPNGTATESSVGVRKRGHKRADEKYHEEHEDGDDSKLLTTEANNSESKDGGMLADVKLGKQESAKECSTPIRRGRSRKDDLTYSATSEAVSETRDTIPMIAVEQAKSPAKSPEISEDEVAVTPLPSKTRGRTARVLSTHHSTELSASAQKKIDNKDHDYKETGVSTSRARGRRAAAMKSVPEPSKDSIPLPTRSRRGVVEKIPLVPEGENGIEKAGPSTTKTVLVDSKSLTESSINTSRGEASGHESEAYMENSAFKTTKTRGRAVKSKANLQSENWSPVRKRGRRQATSKDAGLEDADKFSPSNKNEIPVVSKPLVESSLKTVKKSAEHDDGLHTQNTITPKRRGRQAVAKLESNGSAVSNPTPVRRRGRMVAQVEKTEELKIETEVSDAKEIFLPEKIQSAGRKYIKKINSAAAEASVEHINKPTVNDGRLHKSPEIADLTPVKEVSRPIRTRRASAKETPSTPQGSLEVKPLRKPIRSRKNPSFTSPSQAIPEDKENILSISTELEEQAQSKPTRSRRALLKKVVSEQNTSKPDEQQHSPVGRTRAARGKKAVAAEEISSENDNCQVEERTPKKITSFSSNVIDEKEVIGQPKAKSIRGRRGQQSKAGTEQIFEEVHDSPVPKKATRGRKVQPARGLKTSEDEQSQPETQQKSTRLRRAQDQIMNEELTSSGRKRRKPNILLSGEFVH